jgi:hypothetical protein
MPTEFCQKCKQSHPGRACDYDDQGDCAETLEDTNAKESNEATGVPDRPASTKKSKED